MPAAAVIPASIAYVKFAAVKKLVVGLQSEDGRSRRCVATRGGWALHKHQPRSSFRSRRACSSVSGCGDAGSVTLNKLECLKQAFCLEYVSME